MQDEDKEDYVIDKVVIEKYLNKLPERYRDTLIDTINGKKANEISWKYGVSETQIYKDVQKMKKELKKELQMAH